MPIEFIGMIGVKPEGADGAAVHVIGGEIDLAWLRDFSRAHEAADFDKVLVGYTSTAAEGFVVAGYAAAHTERLAYLIAHRPGFVAPTLAARKAATFDHVSGGRLALHIITGGSDADQAKDGDWLDHDTRYRRTDEYLTLLRRMWTEARPFDHEGEFYKRRQGVLRGQAAPDAGHPALLRRRLRGRRTGSARGTPTCTCSGASRSPPMKQRIAEVRDAALPFGREPRFSVSLRPIIAPTEARAWEQGARHPGEGPGQAGRPRAAERPRRWARSGSSTSPARPRSTTSACGRRSPRRSGGSGNTHRAGRHARAGRGVAPRLLRARRDARSSSAASIRWPTPSSTGAS